MIAWKCCICQKTNANHAGHSVLCISVSVLKELGMIARYGRMLLKEDLPSQFVCQASINLMGCLSWKG